MVLQPEKVSPRILLTRSNLILWLAVFLIALFSRLAFVNLAEQLPVFWDARLYASAAIGLLGYVDRDEPFGKGENSDQDFGRYYVKHLDGEDIRWLYYKVPTLAESQKYIFYSGPVYPAILAVIFALPWDNDFQAARWLNAFLDSLSIILISMLVFMLWGRIPALAAALIQLIYPPLIIACGVLTLETITSFFISVFLFLIYLYYLAENRWAILSAGLVGGILFLTKPTASLLTLPLFGFLIICYFKRKRFLLKSLVLYLIPFLLAAVPWVIFVSSYYGKPAIRAPEYSTANIRSSSSIDYEGYDLDYADADFWTYSIGDHITRDPIGYGNLLLKKIIRMWWIPHDEFRQGPQWFEISYHRLIIILTLLAMAAAPMISRHFLLLPVFIVLYYAGIHTVLHSLPRYNFNALPAVFILIPAYLKFTAERFKSRDRLPKKVLFGIIMVILLLVINSGTVTDILLAYLGSVIPMFITIIIILAVGYIYIRLFLTQYVATTRRLLLWTPFILLSLTSMTGWTRPHLAEWYTPLKDPETKLVTEIQLPPGTKLAHNDAVKLVIDITSDIACTAPISVNINGLFVRFKDGEPPITKAYYIKGSYRAFDEVMNLDTRQLRWYRAVSFQPDDLNSVLRPDGRLAVIISFADSAGIGEGIRLYGDAIDADKNTVTIPSFSHRSIERFKEWGERRIYEGYRLASVNSRSYLFRDGRITTDDLSPRPGMQQGRFRVYLLVRSADFSTKYY